MPQEHAMVIKYRLNAIASEAAAMLPRLRLAGVKALLDSYGATCSGCTSLPDHLRQLVAQMHLPVRVSMSVVGKVEPLPEDVAYGAIALALVHVADEPVDGVGGCSWPGAGWLLLRLVPLDCRSSRPGSISRQLR
jgi:hypothetical protein